MEPNRCDCPCPDDYEYMECEECGFQFCEECELPDCVLCEPILDLSLKCPMCRDPCVQMDGYILCRLDFEIGLVGGDIVYCRTCSNFVQATGSVFIHAEDNNCEGHDLCTDKHENEMIAKKEERILIPNRLICFCESVA